jgi:hypothetical protein
MNLFQLFSVLVALMVFLFFVAQVQREQFVWAIGGLQYNPGGLTVPLGYHVPTIPYGTPAASANAGIWRFVSGTAASFNAKGFTLRQQNKDGSYTSIDFEYYNTGGGPSPPTVGIDVTGMTTSAQIATITETVLEAQGFLVTRTNNALRVQQPNPGDAGDVGFFGDFDGANLLVIGNLLATGDDVFSVYGNTVFFGGFEIAVPLRVGPLLAMGPVAPAIFDGG